MPPRLSHFAAFALAIGLGLIPATFAADDGFQPLFNGKDLSGWITPAD